MAIIQMLAAGDGWNDADFVPALDRRLLVLQEPDVFFIHINVDEAANRSLRVLRVLSFSCFSASDPERGPLHAQLGCQRALTTRC